MRKYFMSAGPICVKSAQSAEGRPCMSGDFAKAALVLSEDDIGLQKKHAEERPCPERGCKP